MEFNWLAVLVAAFVPMIIGAIWYNPKVFGTTWMKVADMTEEKIKSGNMAVIFGVSFLLSFMLAMFTYTLAVHQASLPNLFVDKGEFPTPDSAEGKFIAEFFENYGTLHRTFTHGMVHGIFATVFLVLPLFGINSLFERRGWKYILIHVGYWLVCFAIMGGIICGWM